MKIRPFDREDAYFCFKIRIDAFIQKFYGELSPQQISAAVTAYTTDDFIEMSKTSKVFIVEHEEDAAGFFIIKRIDETTAEIPLIYLHLDFLGKGIGTSCIHFAELWIRDNWGSVNKMFVDTIVPDNNSGFYKKMGFNHTQETVNKYPEMPIKAMRMTKYL